MPYYNGRWHLFSEQQRTAFGERRRIELSKEWHAKWISKSGLKARLWTDKAIADPVRDKPRRFGAGKDSADGVAVPVFAFNEASAAVRCTGG